MKAAYFYGIHDIRIEETPVPPITSDEILMQVCATAICGTDLRIYNYGHFKIPEGTKRVLGHEVSGKICQVGKDVKGFFVGDRIAVAPNIGCGTCPTCMRGFNQMCPDYEAFGISLNGGFAEYMKIPAIAIRGNNVTKIPEKLSYEAAAIIEPFSCCYNSWRNLGTKPGDTVLIIGAGPIGACHVMINKLAGASKIIVADISDTRLNEIKQIGADIVINSAKEELANAVKKVTDGFGADIVITACSVPEMQNQALELAAIHGKINFFGGLPKEKNIVSMNTNLIHYKELIVLGTTGSTINDYRASMNIISSEKVNVNSLVSAKFTIEQTNEAFDFAKNGRGMKTLVTYEN